MPVTARLVPVTNGDKRWGDWLSQSSRGLRELVVEDCGIQSDLAGMHQLERLSISSTNGDRQ